jgi:hypothetical protein
MVKIINEITLNLDNKDVIELSKLDGMKEIIKRNNELNENNPNFYLANFVIDINGNKKLKLIYLNSFDFIWALTGYFYHLNDGLNEEIRILNLNSDFN